MRFTFVQPAPFVSRWKRLGLTDDDLQALEALITARPDAGAVMPGTGGVRKLRFAPPSWRAGKSGAARVCYLAIVEVSQVYLLDVFAKSDKANLSAAERNYLRQWVAQLRARPRAMGER